MILEGVIRRFTALKGGKAPLDARMTHQESLAVGQIEPINFEMTRAGRRFFLGNNGPITGIAPVQALVTTAAQWVIWNTDTSRTMFFDEIGMYLTAGTPGVGGTLWTALITAPAQSGANTAGAAIASASNGGLASKAVVKSGVTITAPTAPVWTPIATNISANATAFAGSTSLEHRALSGALAVPPGQGMALAVVAPAGTTPLFAPFARWIEIETDME